MAGNSLQAMLDRAAKTTGPEETAPPAPKARGKAIAAKPAANQAAPAKAAKPKAESKPSRATTKLIGGHFAPGVSMQLRMIAAEEDTTIQNLLAEALDDLFTKKGKARIASV